LMLRRWWDRAREDARKPAEEALTVKGGPSRSTRRVVVSEGGGAFRVNRVTSYLSRFLDRP